MYSSIKYQPNKFQDCTIYCTICIPDDNKPKVGSNNLSIHPMQYAQQYQVSRNIV